MARLRILIMVFMVSLGSCVAPAFATTPGCEDDFTDALDVPPGYGIGRSELKAFVELSPGLTETVHVLTRLARFVEHDSAAFFDLLGSFAYAGVDPAMLSGLDPTMVGAEALHRYVVVEDAAYLARRHGELPDYVGDAELNFLADALGPLAWAKPILVTPSSFYVFEATERIEAVTKRLKVSARKLILQSRRAQYETINVAVRDDRPPAGPAEVTAAWQNRLTGQGEASTGEVHVALNRADRYLAGDYPELGEPKFKYSGLSLTDQRQRLHDWHVACAAQPLFLQIRDVLASVDRALFEERATSPQFYLFLFNEILHEDTFLDQGLKPALRAAFAELFLHLPVASREEVTGRVKTALKEKFKPMRQAVRELASLERQYARDLAQRARVERAEQNRLELPALADRDARRRAYEAALQAKIELPVPKAKTPARIPLLAPAADAVEVWPRLFDESLDVAGARARFRALITADQAYALRVRRSGFTHRVEFAPRVVAQLLEPRPGEPADLREWIEALSFGPARARGQRGWRKLKTPVLDVYDWEIKLLHSPYRMLGYQTGAGTWRFGMIERTH